MSACRGSTGSTDTSGEYCALERGTGNQGSGRSSARRWPGEAPSLAVRADKLCVRGARLTFTHREDGVRGRHGRLVGRLGAPWPSPQRRRARRARAARKGAIRYEIANILAEENGGRPPRQAEFTPPRGARPRLGMVRIAAYHRDLLGTGSLKMWVSRPGASFSTFGNRAPAAKCRV